MFTIFVTSLLILFATVSTGFCHAGLRIIVPRDSFAGLVPAAHNKLNQLVTAGAGPLRFSGALDEPGAVTVNGKAAEMRNQTLFEAYLDLAPGTHQVEIEAKDFSDNVTTQNYEVNVAASDTTDFGYDANGNTTSRTTATGATNYEWDALDRLTAIDHEDGSRSEFGYDGLSRRVRIIEKDATQTVTSGKRFVWDGLSITEERAADGQTVLKRFFPQGVEILTGPAAGTYTYRTDHLGSIREIVDSTGALAARYDYTAWGEPTLVSGAFDLDFGYTGHYRHQPSGLWLAPFRTYDPKLGRWLSRDPMEDAELSEGPNLYAYVENEPSNAIDPLGLASWRDHWEALKTWTPGELGESLGLGAMATADGFIPFSDPFKESGGYGGCEDGIGFSKGAGQVAFGAAATGATVGLVGKAAPATLYHFTSSTGYSSIMSQGVIRSGSGLFGRGVYASAFSSPFIARVMGAQSTEKCVRIAAEGLRKAPTLIPGAYRILQDVGSQYFK